MVRITGWFTLASGTAPVVNGVLATWNTADLPACAYTLRLLVSDESQVNCLTTHHQSEALVSVLVGGGNSTECAGDADMDGDVDLGDLGLLLQNYGVICEP